MKMNTTTFSVFTYQTCFGTWVFDDKRVNLDAEPFVAGADEIVERLALAAGIPNPARGFMLVFSDRKFKGFQIKLDWKGADSLIHHFGEHTFFGGNTYACPEFGMEGWLCPALYRYFARAPKHIYAAALAIQHTTNNRPQAHEIKIQIH